jgi:hypothetical protein
MFISCTFCCYATDISQSSLMLFRVGMIEQYYIAWDWQHEQQNSKREKNEKSH